MNKKIVCGTCGAEYDASLVRCPYCGTGYAPAEEEEFMDKLGDVRKDLNKQIDKGNKKIGNDLGKTVATIIIAAIVIILLFVGGFLLSGKSERNKSEQKKEEFLQNQGITTEQEETSDDM